MSFESNQPKLSTENLDRIGESPTIFDLGEYNLTSFESLFQHSPILQSSYSSSQITGIEIPLQLKHDVKEDNNLSFEELFSDNQSLKTFDSNNPEIKTAVWDTDVLDDELAKEIQELEELGYEIEVPIQSEIQYSEELCSQTQNKSLQIELSPKCLVLDTTSTDTYLRNSLNQECKNKNEISQSSTDADVNIHMQGLLNHTDIPSRFESTMSSKQKFLDKNVILSEAANKILDEQEIQNNFDTNIMKKSMKPLPAILDDDTSSFLNLKSTATVCYEEKTSDVQNKNLEESENNATESSNSDDEPESSQTKTTDEINDFLSSLDEIDNDSMDDIDINYEDCDQFHTITQKTTTSVSSASNSASQNSPVPSIHNNSSECQINIPHNLKDKELQAIAELLIMKQPFCTSLETICASKAITKAALPYTNNKPPDNVAALPEQSTSASMPTESLTASEISLILGTKNGNSKQEINSTFTQTDITPVFSIYTQTSSTSKCNMSTQTYLTLHSIDERLLATMKCMSVNKDKHTQKEKKFKKSHNEIISFPNTRSKSQYRTSQEKCSRQSSSDSSSQQKFDEQHNLASKKIKKQRKKCTKNKLTKENLTRISSTKSTAKKEFFQKDDQTKYTMCTRNTQSTKEKGSPEQKNTLSINTADNQNMPITTNSPQRLGKRRIFQERITAEKPTENKQNLQGKKLIEQKTQAKCTMDTNISGDFTDLRTIPGKSKNLYEHTQNVAGENSSTIKKKQKLSQCNQRDIDLPTVSKKTPQAQKGLRVGLSRRNKLRNAGALEKK